MTTIMLEVQMKILKNTLLSLTNLNNADNHIHPIPPLGQDMTQGQFFLVSSPRLKNLVCPTIYS